MTIFRAPIPAVVVALLLSGSPAMAGDPTADRFDDYEYWENYEMARMEHPTLVDLNHTLGFYKFFKRVYKEGSSPDWWFFYVEPGTYDLGFFIELTTTKGVYNSDEVVFVPWKQATVYSSNSNFPVAVDDAFESVQVAGKQRVVAFAHFQTEPQGDLVSWRGRYPR